MRRIKSSPDGLFVTLMTSLRFSRSSSSDLTNSSSRASSWAIEAGYWGSGLDENKCAISCSYILSRFFEDI